MARTAKPQFVYAKQSIVIGVGATPVKYKRARVFDRRKEEYVEVDLHMAKPEVEENVGTHYTFSSGQRVPADHPAVVAKPSAFMVDTDDDTPAA